MEVKRIAHIANARRNNQDEYEQSIHETAYWKRRESIEKEACDYSDSARMKLKASKKKSPGDTGEPGKEDCTVIPKKQKMTTPMRVEKKNTRVIKPEENEEQ